MRVLAPVAVAVGVTLGVTARGAEARACDRERAVSVIGRIAVVTSAENMSCAAARAYVRRNTRTLGASGRFFIGRFQCDPRRDNSGGYPVFRALCVYTASVFRIEYYPRGACGHVSPDAGGIGGEMGFVAIRARGLSCPSARRVVRRAGQAGDDCPSGWRCRHDSPSGRTVWTRGERRISFNPAG